MLIAHLCLSVPYFVRPLCPSATRTYVLSLRSPTDPCIPPLRYLANPARSGPVPLERPRALVVGQSPRTRTIMAPYMAHTPATCIGGAASRILTELQETARRLGHQQLEWLKWSRTQIHVRVVAHQMFPVLSESSCSIVSTYASHDCRACFQPFGIQGSTVGNC